MYGCQLVHNGPKTKFLTIGGSSWRRAMMVLILTVLRLELLLPLLVVMMPTTMAVRMSGATAMAMLVGGWGC